MLMLMQMQMLMQMLMLMQMPMLMMLTTASSVLSRKRAILHDLLLR